MLLAIVAYLGGVLTIRQSLHSAGAPLRFCPRRPTVSQEVASRCLPGWP